MRALVTGSTGFIGNQLVLFLLEKGWEVTCLLRHPLTNKNTKIQCIVTDFAESESLENSLKSAGEIDAVFHLGALLPKSGKKKSTEEYITANTILTCRLLEHYFNSPTSSFVYASGLPVIGKPIQIPIKEDHPTYPLHPYLLSKLGGEQACEMFRRTSEFNISSLRISSPYGPGMNTDSVMPLFVQKTIKSENIQLYGSGNRSQNFVHISDVTNALLLAATTIYPGIYNIAGPTSCSMIDLAKKILKKTPASKSQVTFSEQEDLQEDYRWEVDLKKARLHLGYAPQFDIDNGLTQYIEWVSRGSKMLYWWDKE